LHESAGGGVVVAGSHVQELQIVERFVANRPGVAVAGFRLACGADEFAEGRVDGSSGEGLTCVRQALRRAEVVGVNVLRLAAGDLGEAEVVFGADGGSAARRDGVVVQRRDAFVRGPDG